MAREQDRFVWALPFLDLFTCALGAVFMLTILSVQERETVEANDPAGYIFVTARFDPAPLTAREREDLERGVGIALPGGFELTPSPTEAGGLRPPADPRSGTPAPPTALVGDRGTVVVISARLPYGVTPANGGAGEVVFPRLPSAVWVGNESGAVREWRAGRAPATNPLFVIEGREYRIVVRSRQ